MVSRRQAIKYTAVTGGAILHPGGLGFALSATSGDQEEEDNMFLKGHFAPVSEESTLFDLEVEGELPSEISGAFLRNGPNPIFPADPYHIFDGDGMIHGLYIDGGRASYLNRWVQTEGLRIEKAAGKSIFGGLIAGRPIKNTSNTHFIQHHGKLLSLWEGKTGGPYEIDPASLKTIGPYDFSGTLNHNVTAHPRKDPDTGELILFGYTDQKPYLRYSVVSNDGIIRHHAPIDLPFPSMVHDFAITKNYTVFLILPFLMPEDLSKSGYFPDRGAWIAVLPRYGEGKDIQWIPIDPCYVFHIVNAFEQDDGRIYLSACRFNKFDLKRPIDPAFLYEWRIDIEAKSAAGKRLMTFRPTDFPAINPNYSGKRHRYAFLDILVLNMSLAMGKYDYETGKFQAHYFGLNRRGGGATCFVPRSGAQDEDAGWLMNFVYDTRQNSHELWVIDAQDIKKKPVARVKIPVHVPFGFHSTWLDGQSLANQL